MTSRRSSGSSREASAVEPAMSQNSTVSWRRSALKVGFHSYTGLDGVVTERSSGAGVPEGSFEDGPGGVPGGEARKAEMASSSRRRSPTEVTPMSFRYSAESE